MVYLAPQRKKGKLHFENGGKAHDVVVIIGKYSNFLNSGRVNSMVQIYVDSQGYICIPQERYLWITLELQKNFMWMLQKFWVLENKKISV